MKFATLSLLVASVAAEAGYTCVNPEGDAAWAPTDVQPADMTDVATCGEKGTALATDVANDYCLFAVSTDAVVADDTADPVVAEVAYALDSCTLWFKATVADATIKEAKAAADGKSYDAWAWGAGVALADMAAAAEGDADSAKMMTSAIAAIATIAMVAY